ncbi:probable bifunctional methylthioribulose-1-phosphate dehydratase/enolase-phosphatase E1 1 isoform X1 [Musa acuminata AAA Group]|uniref:probable bifunctional methylthioribulose-1-phosphate dehydratase/enolase-phosphatase E1 1 isoform X1 n=1 Tax=Musa acuminata AAA Group TaxID=214697 RepID=UPI0031D61C0D
MAMNVLPLTTPRAYLEGKPVGGTRALVSDHLRLHIYNLGCVTGIDGSFTVKAAPCKPRQFIVVAPSVSPSGVLKARFVPERMYALFRSGAVLSSPTPKPNLQKSPNCTGCAAHAVKAENYQYPFDAAIKLHQLGIDWNAFGQNSLGHPKQFQYRGRHLSGSVRAGPLNGSLDPVPSIQCIVLDIEGTTTPITFVTDVLFPYAHDNVRKHLMSTYDSEETKEDIKLLRAQVEDDLKEGILGSVPVPSDDAGKDEVIDSLVTNVEAMIRADRKITSLKQLQGHIWRTGFENKELQGVVYEDVPEALLKWHANGIKVYIYSSGSREAQRLIFGNTSYGDLRKYLCGFFDTTVGNKRESRSYFEISVSVGVDEPSQVLFVTDVYAEAVAAKAAGLQVLISVRPGNAPLPENHGFKTIKSFADIQ